MPSLQLFQIYCHLISAIISAKIGLNSAAGTCPGFPGYCSESFPGQSCVVVCSRGRPNVPLCQVSQL